MRTLAADLWTGLRTGPARTGLAFASLALGLFAVTILLATLDALRRQAQGLVEAFGAGALVLTAPANAPAPARWTRSQVEFLRENLAGAADVAGVRTLAPVPETDFAVATTDEHLARARNWQLAAGRALDAQDVHQGARHALATAGLCRRHRWQPGDLIPIGNEVFRLVGCCDPRSDPAPGLPPEAVFIPYTADHLEAEDPDAHLRVEVLAFRAAAGTAPEVLRRRVAALLAQPGLGLEGVEWITPESLLEGVRRWQRAIGWTAGAGGALSLLLGAATLAGMLLTAVRERIPEIGLRRALGARRREIAGLFVAEALVLTGAAAVAGMLAAAGVLYWLGTRFPLPFHFGLRAGLIPLALAGGVAVLCSTGPAWLAARLPPAEALRNE